MGINLDNLQTGQQILAIMPDRVPMLAATMARLQSADGIQAAKNATGGMGGGTQSSGGVVAVVRARGIVTHHGTPYDDFFGLLSTDGMAQTMQQVATDPSISTVVIDWDSPGGYVSGVPELSAMLYEMRKTKRVVSVVNALMASAGYWIGSASTEIIAIPSAYIGSVGIYAAHVDSSGAYEKAGIKVTLVSAGEYKTEGDDSKPLTDEAKAYMQKQVDDLYAAFVGDVARNRGVSRADVLSKYGQGRVLSAADALSAGMIDRIDTLDSVISGELAAIQNKRKGGFSADTARRKLALLAATQKKNLH